MAAEAGTLFAIVSTRSVSRTKEHHVALSTHPLGRSGLQISQAGFGSWAVGGGGWPGVTGAIVGARSPRQVDGWIGAASIALTPRDLDDIAAAIRQTGAGVGPAHEATVAQ